MDKKFLPLGIFVALLVLSAQPAYAWGPYTTIYLNEEMKKDPTFQSSSIGQTCIKNWDMFQACAVWTDIPIVYYMTEGGKYEVTHNHRFPDTVLEDATTDEMRACAYGIEIGHLIGDSVAHSQYVPKRIREDLIFNIPWHPLVEAAVEARIIRDHPEIFESGQRVLDIIADDDQFLDQMQTYVMTSAGYDRKEFDVKTLTKNFQNYMGSPNGFYANAFVLPEMYKAVGYGYWQIGVALFMVIASVAAFLISRERNALVVAALPFIYSILMILVGMMSPWDLITIVFFWTTALVLSWVFIRRKYSRIIPLMWLAFIAVGAFLLLFGGLASVVNTADADVYLDQAVNEQVKVSQSNAGWTTRYKYDPTGFQALADADAKVWPVWLVVILGIVGFVAFAVWWKGRRHR